MMFEVLRSRRFRSPAFLTVLVALVGALVIGIAPRPSLNARAQDGSGVEGLPAIFVADSETGVVSGYNIDGELIDVESYDSVFGGDPTILDGLSVDYVSGINFQSVFGASVVAIDANSDTLHVSSDVIDPSSSGVSGDVDFGTGDRLLTGNLRRNNEIASKLLPNCALDEILIVTTGPLGLIDLVHVLQYQPFNPDAPLAYVDSYTFDFDSPEYVAVGDIGNSQSLDRDGFGRFGRDGLAEFIVADPDTGFANVFDHTGSEVATQQFNLGFESGNAILTGNVNGVGGEEILVGHPDTGSIDIFDVSIGAGGLLAPKMSTISASFGPNDQIDLADIDGNGTDEILVAQADTNSVAVFRYDIVDQTIVTAASLPVEYSAGDIFNAMPIRYPDADGDGLFNHWETNGVDVDGDGTVDIDLPSMGADPNHKDLFVEYDYVEAYGTVDGQEPTRAAMELVKEAFALAPYFAGSLGNPDGEPGINLWIDTGGLTENGLLVGDDFGGGEKIPSSAVPAEGMCSLSTDFRNIKAEYFDPIRTHVFRYALSITDTANCDASGIGELGGNDFVEFVDDADEGYDVVAEAQVFMHELGHNLTLLHGGFESLNCKPNYISVMNYNYTTGIYRQDGSTIIDYSPARVTGERANAPLPDLVESALDENLILDPTDNMNFVTFSSPSGVTTNRPANERIDWNDKNGIEKGLVEANIDNTSSCRNDVVRDEPFKGHNDWANIILRVRNSDSSAANAVVAPPFEEPSLKAILELKQDLHTADLEIAQVAEPRPAVAGTELTYHLTVTNNGPNPASGVQVIDTLPDGVSYQSSSAECNAASGEVNCTLDIINVGESRDLTITVQVDGDLGLGEPGPTFITNTATVKDPAEVAVDPDPANNTSTLESEVQIQADLELVSFGPSSTPVELVVGQPALIGFETVVANHGPFGPVTAVFDVVEPSSGPIIAGTSSLARTDELAAGEVRSLHGKVILTCSEPGIHDVEIVNSVGLREAEVLDPNPANDQAAAEISVECLLPVAINIKPGSETNPVNLNSQVPVALLTTTAGQYGIPVDIGASLVDPGSIQFGARDVLLGVADPDGATPRHSGGHFEDALELVDERTRDGDWDLILHFKAAETGLEPGDVEACLRATITLNRTDRLEVFGCDTVTIRP